MTASPARGSAANASATSEVAPHVARLVAGLPTLSRTNALWLAHNLFPSATVAVDTSRRAA